jgi:hypothetical protein
MKSTEEAISLERPRAKRTERQRALYCHGRGARRRQKVTSMRLEFDGEIWFWKGPSPFHFVAVPKAECVEIQAVSQLVTYGWGVIPVSVELGDTVWTTSLFPKEGGYQVPIKAAVRTAESLNLRDVVHVALNIEMDY